MTMAMPVTIAIEDNDENKNDSINTVRSNNWNSYNRVVFLK